MSYRPPFVTEISSIARNQTVDVESINVFDDVRIGNIVKPVNVTRYNFTKDVDLGEIQFQPSFPGAGLEITSNNLISNKIISGLTGTNPLFAGDWGRLIIRDIDVTMSGGRFFDIVATTDPAPLVQIQNGIFQGGDSIGTIKGSLVLWRESGIFNWGAGIICDDNGIIENIGVQFQNTQLIGIPGTQIKIQGDQSLIIINANAPTPSSGGAFLDLDPDIVILENGAIDPVSVANNIINTSLGGTFLAAGSMDQEDVGNFFFNNTAEIDSYIVGLMAMTGNTVPTVISTVDTYVDIEGPILAGSGNERFTFDDDELTYIGIRPIKAAIDISIFMKRESAAASRIVKFALLVNDVVVQEAEATMSSDITNSSFTSGVGLVTSDRIKMQVKNTQDTANVIITTYDFRVLEA